MTMRPKYITVTASGLSNPVILDRFVNGYALAVTMPTAGTRYTLQYSLSDPFVRYSNSYNVSGVWFDSDDALLVNASTNRSSNFAYAPAAVRINVSGPCSAARPITLNVIATEN